MGGNKELYLLDVLDNKARRKIWQRQEQQSAFADWVMLNRLEDENAQSCNISTAD